MDRFEQILRVNKYYEGINESLKTDLNNKEEARKALQTGDLETAKKKMRNIKSKDRRSQIKQEIGTKEGIFRKHKIAEQNGLDEKSYGENFLDT